MLVSERVRQRWRSSRALAMGVSTRTRQENVASLDGLLVGERLLQNRDQFGDLGVKLGGDLMVTEV